MADRATPSATTGKTPSELFIGRRIKTRIDLIKPERLRTKQFLEENREFSVDDQVFVKNFLGGRKWLCGKVIRKISSTCYDISLKGRMVKRHIDRMIRNNNFNRAKLPESENYNDYWDISDSPETEHTLPEVTSNVQQVTSQVRDSPGSIPRKVYPERNVGLLYVVIFRYYLLNINCMLISLFAYGNINGESRDFIDIIVISLIQLDNHVILISFGNTFWLVN